MKQNNTASLRATQYFLRSYSPKKVTRSYLFKHLSDADVQLAFDLGWLKHTSLPGELEIMHSDIG